MNQQASRISIPVFILAVGCLILAATVAVLVVRQLYPNALPLDFLSSTVPQELDKTTNSKADRQTSSSPAIPLAFQDVDRLVSSLPPETRTQVLADATAFAELVKREAVRHSMLQAALESNLASNDRVAYLMERASDQVLVNSYVRLQTLSGVSQDFPSDAQIQNFYDRSQTRFTVGERVLLWQVFIPVPANSDQTTVTEQERYATELAAKIRDNELTFTDAALAHTGHQASRLQGGFMGLLNVSQLVPEVRDALPELAESDVGGPIRGRDGFHIIKRGPLIPAQTLPLAQVREQIRAQLRQMAQRNRQEAFLNATHGKFAPRLSEEDLEGWRLRLSAEK